MNNENVKGSKTCRHCGETKPLEDFAKGKTSDGRIARCKSCVNARVRERRQNGEMPSVALKHHMMMVYKRIKGCRCEECGKIFEPEELEFHHRDPNEKQYEVGDLINGDRSIDLITREAEKCMLVDKRCHQRLHGVGDTPLDRARDSYKKAMMSLGVAA